MAADYELSRYSDVGRAFTKWNDKEGRYDPRASVRSFGAMASVLREVFPAMPTESPTEFPIKSSTEPPIKSPTKSLAPTTVVKKSLAPTMVTGKAGKTQKRDKHGKGKKKSHNKSKGKGHKKAGQEP